jgi:pimeloyl-ACP methyl ester carboxylesterase
MIQSLVLASTAAVAPLALVLRSSDGVSLAATYFGTAQGNARAGLLLLPMLGDARASWADFAARAAAAGVAVLTLDPRGHGASGNPYGTPPAAWGPAEWRAVVEDARVGLRELEARGLPARRVIAAGASIGASAALHLAASEPSLAGAALLSPGDNAARLPASTALEGYGKRHLFIGVGSEDGSFVEIARRLSRAAAGSTELHEQRGPAHGTGLLEGPEGRRVAEQLLRFVLDAADR